MGGMNQHSFIDLTNKFDFSSYRTLLDVGGATAELSVQVAKKYPLMKCINFELPPVEPIAKENIEKHRFG
jgi:hypothetical protein